jgi:hypothetical protein
MQENTNCYLILKELSNCYLVLKVESNRCYLTSRIGGVLVAVLITPTHNPPILTCSTARSTSLGLGQLSHT